MWEKREEVCMERERQGTGKEEDKLDFTNLSLV